MQNTPEEVEEAGGLGAAPPPGWAAAAPPVEPAGEAKPGRAARYPPVYPTGPPLEPGLPHAPPAGGLPGYGYATAPPVVYYYASLPGGAGGGGPPGYDVEAAASGWYLGAFEDPRVRMGFVRKVLGLVLVQLAVTAAMGAAFYFVHPVKAYVQQNVWPFWVSWLVGFMVIVYLSVSQDARRRWPHNMVAFGVFTLAFAFVVANVTAYLEAEVLLLAVLITTAVVGIITVVALMCDFDFTRMGAVLYVVSIAFMVALFISFFWATRTSILVISCVGAALFSLYLLYDLQLLMGGRTVALSPDDYVFASITIYLDIVNIFLNIVNILTLSRDS